MRRVTPLTYAGRTARVITESRAARLLDRLSPRTGAFVLGRTIRMQESVQPFLAAATGPNNRAQRVTNMALVLAHEFAHVRQYDTHGWGFLPKWAWQIARGTWRQLRATAPQHPWWYRPFELLNQCARLTTHTRAAYLAAPFEAEAEVFARVHAARFEPLVETLP